MDGIGGQELGFTLETTTGPVNVRLRRHDERWVATVTAAGRAGTGLAATARGALTAALEPLGARTATESLADPELMGVSAELIRAVR